MADLTPDYKFEKMKLQRQRKQIELNVFDCQLRIVEIQGEEARLQDNIDASQNALKELDDKIASIGPQPQPEP